MNDYQSDSERLLDLAAVCKSHGLVNISKQLKEIAERIK